MFEDQDVALDGTGVMLLPHYDVVCIEIKFTHIIHDYMMTRQSCAKSFFAMTSLKSRVNVFCKASDYAEYKQFIRRSSEVA